MGYGPDLAEVVAALGLSNAAEVDELLECDFFYRPFHIFIEGFALYNWSGILNADYSEPFVRVELELMLLDTTFN